MHKSNLFEILNTFTLKEFKEFGEYIRSPFFNKNESVKKLYYYVKKYYPDLLRCQSFDFPHIFSLNIFNPIVKAIRSSLPEFKYFRYQPVTSPMWW
jgi:hypothetical protein